jgi:dTMP kinase
MGQFITFEGVEGCGKTTQIRLLAEALRQKGQKVTLTREPGGCPIADKIRHILLDAENSSMTPLAELLLYAAARAQHIAEVIAPALDSGEVVLCDRFTDATVAYQGYGRALDLQQIMQLNSMVASKYKPDLTILLDCPAETGLKRAIRRIEKNSAEDATALREERFEKESIEFHKRVREGYLSLAGRENDRFVVIDGSGGITDTADTILRAVSDRLRI